MRVLFEVRLIYEANVRLLFKPEYKMIRIAVLTINTLAVFGGRITRTD